jgi:uncharacterized protein DUF1579
VKLSKAFMPFLFLLVVPAFAQMPASPGPEVKKLDTFLGAWTTEGTISPGPWGTGGKVTGSGTNEWMSGNFFLVGHADSTMPPEVGGQSKAESFMGYDSSENVYTLDEFDSKGRRVSWKGTVTGDTWTFTTNQNYAGQDVKERMTIKVLSPTSHSVKVDVSIDGTNWMPFMEVKSTKK